MAKITQFISLLLVAVFLLTGCTTQSQQLAKENAQLRLEIKSIQAQLTEAHNKIKEHEELYSLRNYLDNQLYLVLRTLIRGDYESAKQYLATKVIVSERKVIFKTEGTEYEFIIPERPMNLRQRAYMKQGNSYGAIYEIYDAGYSDDRYMDRIHSLNVGFVKEGGQWKLSGLSIDE